DPLLEDGGQPGGGAGGMNQMALIEMPKAAGPVIPPCRVLPGPPRNAGTGSTDYPGSSQRNHARAETGSVWPPRAAPGGMPIHLLTHSGQTPGHAYSDRFRN